MARTANPKPPEQAELDAKLVTLTEQYKNAEPVDGDIVGGLLKRAVDLIELKAAVLADLQEVRVMLNMFLNQGLLNEDAATFVTAKLPRKTRKSGENGTADDEGEDE